MRILLTVILALIATGGCECSDKAGKKPDTDFEQLCSRLESPKRDERRDALDELAEKYPDRRTLKLVLDRLKDEKDPIVQRDMVGLSAWLLKKLPAEKEKEQFLTTLLELYEAKSPRGFEYSKASLDFLILEVLSTHGDERAVPIMLEYVANSGVAVNGTWFSAIRFLIRQKQDATAAALLLSLLDAWDEEAGTIPEGVLEKYYLAFHKARYEMIESHYIPEEIAPFRLFPLDRKKILIAMVHCIEEYLKKPAPEDTLGAIAERSLVKRLIESVKSDNELAQKHKDVLDRASSRLSSSSK